MYYILLKYTVRELKQIHIQSINIYFNNTHQQLAQ